MCSSSGEKRAIITDVKLEMNEENHKDFGEKEDNKHVNGRGEFGSEEDNEENTTEKESCDNDGTKSENELFCFANSFRGLFEQDIGGLEENNSKKEGNGDNN